MAKDVGGAAKYQSREEFRDDSTYMDVDMDIAAPYGIFDMSLEGRCADEEFH